MNKEMLDLRVWDVRTRLQGDYVPTETRSIGYCQIGEEDGSYYISTIVEASSSDSAREEAHSRFRNVCLALILSTGSGYDYSPIFQAREVTPGVKVRRGESSIGVNAYIVAPLRSERAKDAECILQILESAEVDLPLQIGLELYRASFFEKSDRSRFLTFISSLEALAPSPEKIKDLSKVLPDIQRVAGKVTRSLPPEKREQFLSRLGKLKRESIQDTIKRLVGQVDQGLAERARELYDDRGSMTHGEQVAPGDIKQKTDEIESIVARVLRYELFKYLT